jgi:hypothetical protein
MRRRFAVMTFSEAKERLRFHCGSHPAIEDPRWKEGFLHRLNPYQGLDEAAYLDLTACIDAVSEHLRHAATLDREIVDSLWGICHFAREWGLAEDGMLRRNKLINATDQKTLDEWITEISYRIAMWLNYRDQEP